MANTYYDSTLTAAQIDSALKAIHGVIGSPNNGKVLCVEDGKIIAKSVAELEGAVLESLSVTSDGDYYPGTGVDGWDEVHVSLNLQDKDVTINGTVTADAGYSGLRQVNVNVPSGSVNPLNNYHDYIESSGTQYIKTGIVPTNVMRVEIIAELNSSQPSSYSALLGTRTAVANECVIFAKFGNNNLVMTWGLGDNDASSPSINRPNRPYLDRKMLYVFSRTGISTGVNSFNDFDKYASEVVGSAGNVAGLEFYLFVLNDTNSPNSATWCSAKLYNCKFYNAGQLIMDLIPAHDSNNVVCLYDNVSGNYFYNAGTGDFTFGTDS